MSPASTKYGFLKILNRELQAILFLCIHLKESTRYTTDVAAYLCFSLHSSQYCSYGVNLVAYHWMNSPGKRVPYTAHLVRKKNKIMSLAGKWMELAVIVSSKLSQTQKVTY